MANLSNGLLVTGLFNLSHVPKLVPLPQFTTVAAFLFLFPVRSFRQRSAWILVINEINFFTMGFCRKFDFCLLQVTFNGSFEIDRYTSLTLHAYISNEAHADVVACTAMTLHCHWHVTVSPTVSCDSLADSSDQHVGPINKVFSTGLLYSSGNL